jgi:hypothetical protein
MPTDDTPATYTVPRKAGEGRPHIVIGAKGLKIVEALAAKGCLMETIAKALRMSHDTLEACRRRQPEVQAALDRGRGVLHDELVSILVQQARAGQFVPAMFLLKTRFGYKEGVQVDMNVEHGGVLVVPAEMTVEDWLARQQAEGNLVDVTPRGHPNPHPVQTIDHQPAPQTIDHQPAPEPEPAPRPIPTGTTIAPFPGPRTRRGD